jgi:16S rRNA (adenine1518-N6/adenine1519-N6)-dimethyltransferase
MMKKNSRLAQAEHFAFDLETRKNLGQNFLADKSIIAQIVARSKVHFDQSGGTCIEIGPGSGALTRGLLDAGWKVIALEKDKRAVDGLMTTLGEEFRGRLSVVETDVLRFDAEPFIQQLSCRPLCIGNIPYYITSDILLWFLGRQKLFSAAILMVQKEVAERLASGPGQSQYGRLTVRTQLTCEVEQVLVAPARAFVPPPKVDSAVVALMPLENPLIAAGELDEFGKFTATLFSARRKMLRKTLLHAAQEMSGRKAGEINAAQIEASAENDWGIKLTQRPEELSPATILKIFRSLKESR